MNKEEFLNNLSAEEKAELLKQLQQSDRDKRNERRHAYEDARNLFLDEVEKYVGDIAKRVTDFKNWLDDESGAFRKIMSDYGEVKGEQQSVTVTGKKFKVEIRSSKVKRFDERADMAAERLMEYLSKYIESSEKGKEDPMYQLAMSLLERNRQGDLDYKSISKLYEMEDKFDEDYSKIMDLFRESNVVQATAINYYFSQVDDNGVWHRIEPSFCRL